MHIYNCESGLNLPNNRFRWLKDSRGLSRHLYQRTRRKGTDFVNQRRTIKLYLKLAHIGKGLTKHRSDKESGTHMTCYSNCKKVSRNSKLLELLVFLKI
jgi:hypothetical protein